MEEILKELGISLDGTYDSEGGYVIDLNSSADFGKVYSKLDKNDDLNFLESNSLLTTDNASLIYRYEDEVEITLLGDFNNDKYQLVINKL